MFKRTMKMLMVALVFMLAVSLAGTTASAATAKKLKMKKKKVTIEVGQKKKLAVTVKPKKAKIKWSTNKKKVATVSKKGVVKGKKKGTAKITAKSGKKKATCTVKVKKASKYDISSVVVLNSKVVRVTLNKAKSLKAGDFAVKVKEDGKGTARKALRIGSITNSGNKIYELILSTDDTAYYDVNTISNGDYVSVTCSKLNGVKTKEAIYHASHNPSNEYVDGIVGNTIDRDIYFSSWTTGYCSFSVSGLPAGLKVYNFGNYITIRGKVAAVQNGTRATVVATDELGKKVTRYVYFYIGSPTQIVAYTETEGMTFIRGNGNNKYINIYSVGGSASHTVTLNQSNPNISVDSDNDIKISDSLPAGTYTIGYTVTDSANRKVSKNVKFTIVNGVRVTGSVRAMDNTGISNARVEFEFDNKNNSYSSRYFSDYSEGTNGTYDMYVAPNQRYDIVVSMNDMYQRVYGVNVGTAAVIRNFNLSLYKVTMTAANGANLSSVEWYDAEEGYLGRGNTLYLKKGSYKITSEDDDSYSSPYKYNNVSFTVNGNMTVRVTVTSRVQKALVAGGVTSVNLSSSDYTWVSFKPSETGSYTIKTDKNVYMDSDEDDLIGATIRTEDNYYVGSVELSTTGDEVYLSGGKTYYLRISYADYPTSVNITITKAGAED